MSTLQKSVLSRTVFFASRHRFYISSMIKCTDKYYLFCCPDSVWLYGYCGLAFAFVPSEQTYSQFLGGDLPIQNHWSRSGESIYHITLFLTCSVLPLSLFSLALYVSFLWEVIRKTSAEMQPRLSTAAQNKLHFSQSVHWCKARKERHCLKHE